MPQLPFRDRPLKLPQGEKSKSLSYINLMKLEPKLKKEKFTGYLVLDLPEYGLKAGGKGKILFIEGDIIAASFETDNEVLVRNKALEEMFNFSNINTDVFSYDETDIWLAIEMNRLQLFQYEPPEKKEVAKPTVKQFEPQLTERREEGIQEPEESGFIVGFKKKEKKLSREELLAKYKLKETTDDEAEALIKRATEGE